MTHNKIALLVLGAVVAAAVGGWAAGTRVASPAEVAARTAAPVASPILVPAEDRLLSTGVITRGTARFGSPQELTIAASTIKPDLSVITLLPIAGSDLGEGSVILRASGRPTFLLQGDAPMYRDLALGLQGDDVLAFEQAMQRLGYDPGQPDGVYDAATVAAVSEWYTAEGFVPFTATLDQLDGLHTLQSEQATAHLESLSEQGALGAAEADLAAAQIAFANDGQGEPAIVALARRSADADNAAAHAEVIAARADLAALQAGTPGERIDRPGAQGALDVALADHQAARLTGVAAVADAQVALLAAEAALGEAIATTGLAGSDTATARSERDAAASAVEAAAGEAQAAEAAGAAEVQAAQAVLRTPVTITRAPAGEIASASARLRAAQQAAQSTELAGNTAIQAARAEADAAGAAVVAAQQAVAIARESADVRGQLAADLAERLELASATVGVQVPADEVVFVPSVPLRVESVGVTPGDPAVGSVMQVTDRAVVVDSSLALSEAPLVTIGMPVVIDEPDLGINTTGTVSRIADAPGTNGVDGFHVYVEVTVEESVGSIVGSSVRLKIPIESSGGTVLAVPTSALALAADGSSRIQRSIGGELEFITVEPGLSASGFVGVVPLEGELRAGDLVVIGFDQASP